VFVNVESESFSCKAARTRPGCDPGYAERAPLMDEDGEVQR
jgi:hypothetical protein